jgi:hypothetical protein
MARVATPVNLNNKLFSYEELMNRNIHPEYKSSQDMSDPSVRKGTKEHYRAIEEVNYVSSGHSFIRSHADDFSIEPEGFLDRLIEVNQRHGVSQEETERDMERFLLSLDKTKGELDTVEVTFRQDSNFKDINPPLVVNILHGGYPNFNLYYERYGSVGIDKALELFEEIARKEVASIKPPPAKEAIMGTLMGAFVTRLPDNEKARAMAGVIEIYEKELAKQKKGYGQIILSGSNEDANRFKGSKILITPHTDINGLTEKLQKQGFKVYSIDQAERMEHDRDGNGFKTKECFNAKEERDNREARGLLSLANPDHALAVVRELEKQDQTNNPKKWQNVIDKYRTQLTAPPKKNDEVVIRLRPVREQGNKTNIKELASCFNPNNTAIKRDLEGEYVEIKVNPAQSLRNKSGDPLHSLQFTEGGKERFANLCKERQKGGNHPRSCNVHMEVKYKEQFRNIHEPNTLIDALKTSTGRTGTQTAYLNTAILFREPYATVIFTVKSPQTPQQLQNLFYPKRNAVIKGNQVHVRITTSQTQKDANGNYLYEMPFASNAPATARNNDETSKKEFAKICKSGNVDIEVRYQASTSRVSPLEFTKQFTATDPTNKRVAHLNPKKFFTIDTISKGRPHSHASSISSAEENLPSHGKILKERRPLRQASFTNSKDIVEKPQRTPHKEPPYAIRRIVPRRMDSIRTTSSSDTSSLRDAYQAISSTPKKPNKGSIFSRLKRIFCSCFDKSTSTVNVFALTEDRSNPSALLRDGANDIVALGRKKSAPKQEVTIIFEAKNKRIPSLEDIQSPFHENQIKGRLGGNVQIVMKLADDGKSYTLPVKDAKAFKDLLDKTGLAIKCEGQEISPSSLKNAVISQGKAIIPIAIITPQLVR